MCRQKARCGGYSKKRYSVKESIAWTVEAGISKWYRKKNGGGVEDVIYRLVLRVVVGSSVVSYHLKPYGICCGAGRRSFQYSTPLDMTGLSYPTVFNWYKKFRDNIPKERLDTLLSNNVACDEMFTKDTAIMGAKEKGTRNIALKVLHDKHPNKSHAVDFLQRFVTAHSNLFTDGSGIYKGIGNWHKLKHTYELHKKFEFSLTAEIEGVWACFRTFVRRMYHHVTKYKLEDLVAEFCLRFRQDDIFDSPQKYLAICLSTKPFAL